VAGALTRRAGYGLAAAGEPAGGAPAVVPRCAEATASWHARGRNVTSAVSPKAMPEFIRQILAHLVGPAGDPGHASGTAVLTRAQFICSCEPLRRRANPAVGGLAVRVRVSVSGCLLVLWRLERGTVVPSAGQLNRRAGSLCQGPP
jgi:hypothetical protein